MPSDWCHVFNFQQSDKPGAIELPPGEGRLFKADMSELANELKTTIPATFESEEYQARIQELQEEVTRRQQQGHRNIRKMAALNHRNEYWLGIVGPGCGIWSCFPGSLLGVISASGHPP